MEKFYVFESKDHMIKTLIQKYEEWGNYAYEIIRVNKEKWHAAQPNNRKFARASAIEDSIDEIESRIAKMGMIKNFNKNCNLYPGYERDHAYEVAKEVIEYTLKDMEYPT